MACIATCCPSFFSCLTGLPCIGKCFGYCGECCGITNDAGSEIVEPLVHPSADSAHMMTSAAVASSPIVANVMATPPGSEELRPLKRRSVSFMMGPVENDSLIHHPPGSPARSIIKKPEFGTPEELL
jgi:hypothetical protein